jgi:hypothetical protein
MDGSQFITLTRKSRLGVLNEPPCAEPHAGWCGGWRLDTSGYPIMWFYIKWIQLFALYFAEPAGVLLSLLLPQYMTHHWFQKIKIH